MTQVKEHSLTLSSIDRVDIREARKIGYEKEVVEQFYGARFLPLSERGHTFVVCSPNSHCLSTFQSGRIFGAVVMALDFIVLYERTCY